MYVIIKQGVYQHGVYGLFVEKSTAIEECRSLARADEDAYHRWVVYPIPLGEVFTKTYAYSPSVVDGGFTAPLDYVFKCTKETCDVH